MYDINHYDFSPKMYSQHPRKKPRLPLWIFIALGTILLCSVASHAAFLEQQTGITITPIVVTMCKSWASDGGIWIMMLVDKQLARTQPVEPNKALSLVKVYIFSAMLPVMRPTYLSKFCHQKPKIYNTGY